MENQVFLLLFQCTELWIWIEPVNEIFQNLGHFNYFKLQKRAKFTPNQTF